MERRARRDGHDSTRGRDAETDALKLKFQSSSDMPKRGQKRQRGGGCHVPCGDLMKFKSASRSVTAQAALANAHAATVP